MDKLLGSFKSMFSNIIPGNRPQRYKAWVSSISTIYADKLIPLFVQLEDKTDPTIRLKLLSKVTEVLQEMEPLFTPDKVEIPQPDDELQIQARGTLLELWNHILKSIRASEPINIHSIVFGAIACIVKRIEFSAYRIPRSKDGKFIFVSDREVAFAAHYVGLLKDTLIYVSGTFSKCPVYCWKREPIPEIPPMPPVESDPKNGTSASGTSSDDADDGADKGSSPASKSENAPSGPESGNKSPSTKSSDGEGSGEEGDDDEKPKKPVSSFGSVPYGVPVAFAVFCARILAISCWRVPGVAEMIKDTLLEDSETLGSFVAIPGIYKLVDSQKTPFVNRWDELNAQTGASKDPECLKPEDIKGILHALTLYGDFFALFVSEWSQHVRDVCTQIKEQQAVNWIGMKCYPEIASRFCQARRELHAAVQQTTRTYTATEKQMLGTESGVIVSVFVRELFGETRINDTRAIALTLNDLDAWFSEVNKRNGTLGNCFDIDFFCEGLEIILSTDHHVLIAKLLSILYKYCDLFRSNSRVVLLCDHLLERHFFHLFLHWDDNVRVIFCQLLIFKFLRNKRKYITNEHISRIVPESASTLEIDTLVFSKLESYVNVISNAVSEQLMRRTEQMASGPVQSPILGKAFKASLPANTTGVPMQKFVVKERPKKVYIEEDYPFADKESKESGSSTAGTDKSSKDSSDSTLEKKPGPLSVPKELYVYLDNASKTYTEHMSRYTQWENSESEEAPQLITLMP